MGYDLTMTKVKKVDLEVLKKEFPKISLSDFWDDGIINYYTEEEFEKEYGKETLETFKAHHALFCKELVYTCHRVFKEYPLIPNDENDLTMEMSLEEVKKLFSWFDHFLRNDYYDNIEKYYGMAYDTAYLELLKLVRDMKEDEVVLFHHDW